MRNFTLSVVLFLACMVTAKEVSAATYDAFLECDTCTTDQSFKTRANTYAAQKNHSDATYIIQNKSSKDFVKVRVVNIPSFEPGVPDIVATTILSLNSYDLDIRYQKESYDTDISGTIYEVPNQLGESGYDFIFNSQVRNN